jgi:hypothetical protein
MSTNGIRKNLLDIPDPRRRARELSRLVAEQQALLTDLAQLRRETIAELRAGGLTGHRSPRCSVSTLGESPSLNSPLPRSPRPRRR